MNRREYLASVCASTAPLAGCLGQLARGEGFEEAEDPWSNVQEGSGLGQSVQQADFELEAGQWAAKTFAFGQRAQIGYLAKIDTGNAGETFVLDSNQLDDFEDQAEISHYQRLHDTGTDLRGYTTLPVGEYAIVLDNTSYGEQAPEGSIAGTIRFGAGL